MIPRICSMLFTRAEQECKAAVEARAKQQADPAYAKRLAGLPQKTSSGFDLQGGRWCCAVLCLYC